MLDSLVIKNFRSLADFEVAKLGRLNLIVGKNNAGKSTVLEALRIYAGNAQRAVLDAIAAEHDEKFRLRESERPESESTLPFQDLFTGRVFPADDDAAIQIGDVNRPGELLRIQHAFLMETEEELTDESGITGTRVRRRIVSKAEAASLQAEVRQAVVVSKGERIFPPQMLDEPSPRIRIAAFDTINATPCSLIPPQFIAMDELGDEWDRIVFTEHEEVVRQALRIIAPEFENLTFVRNEEARPIQRPSSRRGARVKLAGAPRPVPLNSLGDGMLRVLQLALKMFAARGGFLLIDEFENGLHYSVQEKIWALLFEMAQQLDIQVFATTHSWDCIESFTQVAVSRPEIDGVLFRLGRSVRTSDRGRVIATVFDEDALDNITQGDVEVR
jgi:predicted ATPase